MRPEKRDDEEVKECVMKVQTVYGFILAGLLGMAGASGVIVAAAGEREPGLGQLPAPVLAGRMSLEEAIARRRSLRQFGDRKLSVAQIAQLCWAGQGITEPDRRLRACPSAGALYPMELYVVTAAGVDHYKPVDHAMLRVISGDVRRELQGAALGQESVGDAPACVVIAAVVQRTARKYGQRAERYCYLEAGHVAQNILLQATALNLGGVTIGAFEDDKVAALLKLPKGHRVLYLLPIGHPVGTAAERTKIP